MPGKPTRKELLQAVTNAEDNLQHAKIRRDHTILDALRAGISGQDIGDAADLTRQAVFAIRDKHWKHTK